MSRKSLWCVGIASLSVILILSTGRADSSNDDSFQYVGTKACKKCHYEVWESWAKTKMANCFEVLKPNSELKPSKKSGLTDVWIEDIKANKAKSDPKIAPDKDHTRDEDCLRCHTTGHGEVGGYAIPDQKNKKAKRRAKKLQGVGCESCHGAGSEYVKIFEKIQANNRPYTREELFAAGMTRIGEKTCVKCHNKDSPLVGGDYVFEYEQRKDEGIHEHLEMKLRKE